MILLIDNYDSFTYNLAHLIGGLGEEVAVRRNDALSASEALAFGAEAIVLSPGPCTPKEAGVCVDLVRTAAGRAPIFGVCLGHQAIAAAYGAPVERAKRIMHGKKSRIRHKEDPLFSGIPPDFVATRYHSLSVPEPQLPPELLAIAVAEDDGEVMAIRHKSHPVWGVQFHPESIGSEHGAALFSNFLKSARARIAA